MKDIQEGIVPDWREGGEKHAAQIKTPFKTLLAVLLSLWMAPPWPIRTTTAVMDDG
jgi:hypothetical protein